MDILRLAVGLNQVFVPGHGGENTELNLGVVGIGKEIAFPRHKQLPNLSSQLHPDRNILQVRLGAADSACRRDGLVKGAVNPSVGTDVIGKPVGVGGLQLRHLPVIQDLLHKGIVNRQLLENAGRCGISCLGLLSAGHVHLIEKDLAQLLRGINIEGLSGFTVDFLLQLIHPDRQLLPVFTKALPLYGDALLFHMEQGIHHRHLHLPEQHIHSGLLQLVPQDIACRICHIGHKAGAAKGLALFRLPGCLPVGLS